LRWQKFFGDVKKDWDFRDFKEKMEKSETFFKVDFGGEGVGI